MEINAGTKTNIVTLMIETTEPRLSADFTNVFRNSSYLVTSQIFSKAVAMVSLVWLARFISVDNYGVLNVALSFWAIVMIFVEGGSGALLIREVARNRSLASLYFSGTLLLKLVVAIVSLIVALPLLSALGIFDDPNKIKVFLILGAGQYLLQIISSTITVLFRAREAFKFESMISVFSSFIAAIMLIVAILVNSSFLNIVVVMLVSNLLTVFLNLYFYTRRIGSVRLTYSREFFRRYARATIPFAVTFIVGGISLKIGAPLIAHFSGDQAVGIYSASMRIMEGFLFVPSALMTTLYPMFSRSFVDSNSNSIKALSGVMHFLILVAVPVCFLSTYFRTEIVMGLYGQKYTETSVIWPEWTIWLFVCSAKSILALFLIAMNEHKMAALVNVVGFVITLLLCLLLIPGSSYVGATTAVLAAEIMMLLAAAAYLQKMRYQFFDPRKVIKLVILNLVLIGVFYLVNLEGIVLGTVVFMTFYVLGIYLAKIFAPDEIAVILDVFRKKRH